jgi:two-component SAPR family response regulator
MQRNLLMINVVKNIRKRISHAGYLEVQLNFQMSLTWGTVYDDEENVRNLIKNMILENKMDVIIDEFEDGCELEKADVFEYDIIFLDVSMKEQSGVETARHIREKQQEKKVDIWGSFPLIIFITGYSEYMPDAFSFHAFGYLYNGFIN